MDKLKKQGSRIAELIEKGREQGYLTYADVNDHLPEDISDPDQVDEIIGMINDLGLQVQRDDSERLIRSSSNTPVRVKAVINIFSALLAFPTIAQESIFDELKDDLKFSFLFVILDLYRQTPDIKPSRVIESLESEQIKGYFSEAVVAGLELSEKNALKLVNDCMDILLKNQKDREQTLKDKYNVRSITPAERRDLQQIILKKQEITDDDRNWLKKLSSKQD